MKSSLPRIKVCGLTRSADAELAARLGAWALGFVFYKKSPRAISPEGACALIREAGLPGSGGPLLVGVFVNADLPSVVCTVEVSGVQAVQLHGDETPEFCSSVRRLLPGRKIIKARRLQGASEIPSLLEYAEVCDQLLLDSFVPGSYGGTGQIADWNLVRDAVRRVEARFEQVILAGGLNARNFRMALEEVAPGALDVSSGLESAPGEKSLEKLKEFFDLARGWGEKR